MSNTISAENFVSFYLGKRLYNDAFTKDLATCLWYTNGDSGTRLKELLEFSSPEITNTLKKYAKNNNLADILYHGKQEISELFGETVELKVPEHKNRHE